MDNVIVVGFGLLLSYLIENEHSRLKIANQEISKSHNELSSAYNQLKAYTEVLEFTTHELDRKTLNISEINTLTHILSTRLPLESITNRISSFLSKTFNAKNVWILFLNENDCELFSYSDDLLKRNKMELPDRKNWFYLSLFEAAHSVTLKGEELTDLAAEIFWTYERPNDLAAIPLFRTEGVFGAIILGNIDEQLFQEDINLLQIMAGQVAIALERVRMYDELEDNYLATIKALASSIEAKDPYTRGHSERVTKLSVAVGELMGLSSQELVDLKYGGLLHDIGKIGIPEIILNKPGSLTIKEFMAIQKHPIIGEEIVKPVAFLQRTLPLIRNHHERYDGLGYPDGLKGDQLPLAVRILSVCDSYDAMSTDRPYRKALPLELCRKELKNKSNSQFDPEVVTAFLNLLDQNYELVINGNLD